MQSNQAYGPYGDVFSSFNNIDLFQALIKIKQTHVT